MTRMRRLLIVWLLCLAASPLTAPFSTCDLFDLLSDDVRGSLTVVKPPKTEESAPTVLPPVVLAFERPSESAPKVAATATPDRLRRLSFPLRL